MDFRSTPLNVSTLLLVALGVIVILFLLKKKVDSNIPLVFYAAIIVFTLTTERELPGWALYSGLVFALFLRFEFLNPILTKAVLYLEIGAMTCILWSFMIQVFGPGIAPF
jgi:hypothetical protein